MVDVLGLRPGQLGVRAVHARAGGVHEMARRSTPAALEHVGEANEVRLDVGARVLERVAHPGLRGEMEHALGALFFEKLLERIGVRDVQFVKSEPGMLELRDAILLELDRVIRRKIVEADDFIAALEQAFRAVHADEAGRTRDEYLHSPSNSHSAKTLTPSFSRRLRPPTSGRSMMKQHSTSSAPILRRSVTAASAVPPVAMRSSIRSTRSPGATASVWISMRSAPYSSS